jgi:DNA invertase Pin-like site-specific DNA recombinase
MRAAIYARYSSDNQRDASIDDQSRQCQQRIKTEGWSPTEVYSDRAISGASTLRPGYQKMLEDARNGVFDILVAEALDRLSRDQEDIAGLYKQLTFSGVRLITLSEGEVNELHVGLKGTMNALFLKDLAQKTRRGLEGRVRQGKSGGGNAMMVSTVLTAKPGAPRPSMATGAAVRVFLITNSTLDAWSGTDNTSSRIRTMANARHALILSPNGSLGTFRISGL